MAVPSLEELLGQVKASSKKGNLCSQIVLDVGLDHLGERKPDLVKAAGGLAGAHGFVEVTCGALTSAGVLIASAAVDRMERDQMYMIIQELEERFNQDIASFYPGNRCGDFLDADPNKLPSEVCPPIIARATQIALELLEENGIFGIVVKAATVHSLLGLAQE